MKWSDGNTDNPRRITVLCSETYAPIRSNTPNNSFCIRDGVALFYKGSAPKVFDIPEGVKIIGRYDSYRCETQYLLRCG